MDATVMTGKEITLIVASYLLGCVTAGYYWVRWRTGQDIRQLGSRSVGAKNAGRICGPSGFLVTFLFDFGKGYLAVELARFMGAGQATLSTALLAVVVGHNWPMQLRFQGGKGVSTSIGGILAYNGLVGFILLVTFVPLYLLVRNFTLSGLFAFAVTPLVAFFCKLGNDQVLTLSLLALLIVIAHRKNIREELTRLSGTGREVKDGAHQSPHTHRLHHEH